MQWSPRCVRASSASIAEVPRFDNEPHSGSVQLSAPHRGEPNLHDRLAPGRRAGEGRRRGNRDARFCRTPAARRRRRRANAVHGPSTNPYRALGSRRAFRLHDYIVSRRLAKLVGDIDIVHTWPLGSLQTLTVAAELGIPAVLERPNAHTRFAYAVVRAECERIGVSLPRGHEHAYDPEILHREEQEYGLASSLLCPSDFVVRTFLDEGFEPARLSRHQYGFDAKTYRPKPDWTPPQAGIRMLFVGGCAPRKGLHFALEAWLASTASGDGSFRIAGAFVPGYAEYLASMLSHPSIEILGQRNDVADLMRESDILVLASIEKVVPSSLRKHAPADASFSCPMQQGPCASICTMLWCIAQAMRGL